MSNILLKSVNHSKQMSITSFLGDVGLRIFVRSPEVPVLGTFIYPTYPKNGGLDICFERLSLLNKILLGFFTFFRSYELLDCKVD